MVSVSIDLLETHHRLSYTLSPFFQSSSPPEFSALLSFYCFFLTSQLRGNLGDDEFGEFGRGEHTFDFQTLPNERNLDEVMSR